MRVVVFVTLQNAYYLRTQHSLDVVDGVVTSLKAANLTNAGDKILVASEDSSALSALSSAIPAVKLVYDVKYLDPISVDETVLRVCFLLLDACVCGVQFCCVSS